MLSPLPLWFGCAIQCAYHESDAAAGCELESPWGTKGCRLVLKRRECACCLRLLEVACA